MKLELTGLKKRFAGGRDIGPIDLFIADGMCAALVGPSGSGKTTVLRMIAGLETADEGRILIGDDDVTAEPSSRRRVTLMFQRPLLFPHLTAVQNVMLAMKTKDREKALRLLERVGLAQRTDGYASELSGGEQQRVSLARALAGGPGLLLLDEPFASLDLPRRRELQILIRELTEEEKITTLLVTHDRGDAMAMAEHVYVLEDGKVIEQGNPVDLSLTSRFFGDGIEINGEWVPLQEVSLVLRPTKGGTERVMITKELRERGMSFFEVVRETGERVILHATVPFSKDDEAFLERR